MSSSPPVVERLFPFLFLSTEWLISSNKIVPTANAQCGGGKSKRKTITIELSFVRLASIANVRGNWRVHFERERATRVISFFFLVARHQLVKEKEEMMMKVNGCSYVYTLFCDFFFDRAEKKNVLRPSETKQTHTHTQNINISPPDRIPGFPSITGNRKWKERQGVGGKCLIKSKEVLFRFPRVHVFLCEWVDWEIDQ